jgi:hypothetical protein
MQPITHTGLKQKLNVIRDLRADQEFYAVIGYFGLTCLPAQGPPKNLFQTLNALEEMEFRCSFSTLLLFATFV